MKDSHLSGKGKADFKKQSRFQIKTWLATCAPTRYQRASSSYGTGCFLANVSDFVSCEGLFEIIKT